MAGLANVGQGIDVTFKIGSAVTTTTFANTATSIGKLAFIQASTTAQNYQADYRVTTTMLPIGVITSVQDSQSSSMTVRVSGIAKVYANDSILCGAYVTAADQTAGDAEAGYVTYLTPTGDLTGSVASKRIIGIALEQAQKTGAAISILLTPGIAY